MLTNYHTHTTFCDGKNSPEEIVLSAIDQGLDILGFSGHGYIDFDPLYCMKDTQGYIREINRLKEKYKGKIRILLGVEEDSVALVNRTDFDYIIGSSHFTHVDGKYLALDNDIPSFKEIINLWNGDYIAFAEEYFSRFADYVNRRKPDIVGHFDLLTKFDDLSGTPLCEMPEYNKVSEKYLCEALRSECVFEVNTGAMSRGYRRTPYPSPNLLRLIRKEGGRVILSADSHSMDTLTFAFDEARALLRDVGFKKLSVLTSNGFTEQSI